MGPELFCPKKRFNEKNEHILIAQQQSDARAILAFFIGLTFGIGITSTLCCLFLR